MRAHAAAAFILALAATLTGHDVRAQRAATPPAAVAEPRAVLQREGYSLGAFASQCGETYEVVVHPEAGGGYSIVLYDENGEPVETRVDPHAHSLGLVTRGGVETYAPDTQEDVPSKPTHRRLKSRRHTTIPRDRCILAP
jgi:hypothetical protein